MKCHKKREKRTDWLPEKRIKIHANTTLDLKVYYVYRYKLSLDYCYICKFIGSHAACVSDEAEGRLGVCQG